MIINQSKLNERWQNTFVDKINQNDHTETYLNANSKVSDDGHIFYVNFRQNRYNPNNHSLDGLADVYPKAKSKMGFKRRIQ